MFCCRLLTLFKINFFKKFFLEHYRSQTFWIQIRTHILGPICLHRLSADDKSCHKKGELKLRYSLKFAAGDFFKFWSEVIIFFSYSTQLSKKFILLINVKIRIVFGILTFISMINTTSKSLKARKIIIFYHFS